MHWLLWCVIGLATLLALGTAMEALATARDTARFPPPGEMIGVGGRRLHLFCKGPQGGPTVIIEQGAGSPSILWWPIQDRLAAFARVCTYDRAGYLWSDPAPRVRSLEDRVEDLHTLLVNGKIPAPYIMVAHSFGGLLVRLYARTYPTEIAGMVLVDTPEEAVILRPSYDDYVRKLGYFATALEAAACVGLIRVALRFLRETPEGLDTNAFRALKALAARPAFFRAMQDDPLAASRAPATTRSLGCARSLGNMPLVVITHCLPFPGPASVLEDGWLDGQRRLASLSTRGELVFARHSNHMVHSDEPDTVVAAIERVMGLAKEAVLF